MGSDPEYTGPALVDVNLSWPIMTLENICDDIIDCPHSTPRLTNDGYYMVRTQDIRKGFYDTQNSVKVSSESYIQRTKRAKPQHGDILLSREGTYFGDAAEVPKDIQLCLGQRIVLLRPCQEQINPTFLRIWMNSKNFQNYLLAFRDGTVAERLNLSTIRKLPIPVPSLEVQAQVISFITPLEGKETLNRRMNTTLEGMAQALFKSWFVDFDPVIDNALAAGNPIPEELAEHAEVRRKALADDTANREAAKQFPAAFQLAEEMGWIPEGWEVKSFDTLAQLDTTSIKPFEHPKTLWEHYSIPSYDSSGMPSWDKGSEIKSNKYLVKPGAVLSSKLNPKTERTWWPFMIKEKFSICSTEFMQFVPHKHNEQAFIYSLIRSEPFQRNILERVTGTTGSRQRAQPKQIAEIAVTDCGESLRTEYIKVALPLFQSIRNNSIQTQSLTNLRDTLLPKLISGELRIPDAEKLTEEELNPEATVRKFRTTASDREE